MEIVNGFRVEPSDGVDSKRMKEDWDDETILTGR